MSRVGRSELPRPAARPWVPVRSAVLHRVPVPLVPGAAHAGTGSDGSGAAPPPPCSEAPQVPVHLHPARDGPLRSSARRSRRMRRSLLRPRQTRVPGVSGVHAVPGRQSPPQEGSVSRHARWGPGLPQSGVEGRLHGRQRGLGPSERVPAVRASESGLHVASVQSVPVDVGLLRDGAAAAAEGAADAAEDGGAVPGEPCPGPPGAGREAPPGGESAVPRGRVADLGELVPPVLPGGATDRAPLWGREGVVMLVQVHIVQ